MPDQNNTAQTQVPPESATPAQQPAAPLSPETPAVASSNPHKGEMAYLGEIVEISPDARLPHLDKGPIKAYGARAKGEVGSFTHYALVCEKSLTPRSERIDKYTALMNPSLSKLVKHGNVFWPPTQSWHYVLIYENRILGKKLMQSLDQQGLGWRQEQVMRTVIQPMISVFQDLRDAEIIHGDIRPTNMFESLDKSSERIILGDCISTPPSLTQDVVFESVERAMCDPISKGTGMIQDDLYSFGVSLVMIMRHKDPLHGKNKDQIISEKINEGSYVSLTGQERFSGPMLELLRGLLHDDINIRWGLDELLAWADGQRLSPRQNIRRIKASRPIDFNGERYYRPVRLAMDLNKNQPDAIRLIDSGELESWIARSLDDSAVKTRVEQILQSGGEAQRGPGFMDRMTAKMSMALDAEAPIRYRGLNINPDGFGYALTEAAVLKKDLTPYMDIISNQFATQWVSAQSSMKLDVGALVSKFENCRAYLKQPHIGYGIERCIYTANPNAPCLSDTLKKYNAQSIPDLMDAFEDIAQSESRPVLFIDRHVAAFIASKDRKDIEGYFGDLSSADYYRRVIGNIATLATIQHRGKMKPYPGIAKWAASILTPVYERYHDRELRDLLKKQVDSLVEAGDLSKIILALSDAKLQQGDITQFREAMVEYYDLVEEDRELGLKLASPATFTKNAGSEIAAIISGVLAGLIILTISFIKLF